MLIFVSLSVCLLAQEWCWSPAITITGPRRIGTSLGPRRTFIANIVRSIGTGLRRSAIGATMTGMTAAGKNTGAGTTGTGTTTTVAAGMTAATGSRRGKAGSTD